MFIGKEVNDVGTQVHIVLTHSELTEAIEQYLEARDIKISGEKYILTMDQQESKVDIYTEGDASVTYNGEEYHSPDK